MTKRKFFKPHNLTVSFLVGVLLCLSIIKTNELQAVETIPDFTIETLDGNFTLSEHLGKTVVLFFSFPG